MLCKPGEADKMRFIFLKQAIGTLEMIKATLCICSRVGLISLLSLPFCFFLFPVKPVTSQSFWKSSDVTVMAVFFLLLLCTICLLWWSPLSRAYHELYLTSLEVFSQCRNRSSSGGCPAAPVCTVSQNSIFALYIFLKISICPVGVWCQNNPFGLSWPSL